MCAGRWPPRAIFPASARGVKVTGLLVQEQRIRQQYISRQHQRRRRATLAAAVAIAAGTFLGVFVSAVLVFWGVVAGVFVYFHVERTRALLVWPRHGYADDRSRLRLARTVVPAAAGLATPFTVVDETFPTPGTRPVQWLFAALPVLVVVTSLFSYATGADSLYALLGPGAGASPVVRAVIFVLQALAILVIGLLLLRSIFRQQAVTVAATPEQAEALAERIVRRIKRGSGPVLGAQVMQCSDVSWPGAIREALAEADVALFDVTDLGQAQLDDLALAYQRLPPERVVLLCAAKEVPVGAGPAQESAASGDSPRDGGATAFLPPEKLRQLEETVGAGLPQQSQVVMRPARDPGPGPAGTATYRHIEKDLRASIADALSAAA